MRNVSMEKEEIAIKEKKLRDLLVSLKANPELIKEVLLTELGVGSLEGLFDYFKKDSEGEDD